MRRLRIAYAMINGNRRDGSARALTELAERIAVKHEVHLFARRVEEFDLSHIKWHKMAGLSCRRSSILRVTICWRNLCCPKAASISSIQSDQTPTTPTSLLFHKSSRQKAKSLPNNQSRAGLVFRANSPAGSISRPAVSRKKVLYSPGEGAAFFALFPRSRKRASQAL